MTRTPAQALAVVAAQSKNGPAFGVGTCLMQCHNAYAIPSDGTPSAAVAWSRAKFKHATTSAAGIPVGAFVFWTGGSQGFGHIAISAGSGNCWSSDINRAGYFDLVPISLIAKKWPGHTFVGWSEDVDGVRVLIPTPPPPAQENPNMTLLADLELVATKHNVTRVYAARVLLRAGLNAAIAAGKKIRAGILRTALGLLKGMDNPT